MKFLRVFPVILCIVFLNQLTAIAAAGTPQPSAATKTKSPPAVLQPAVTSSLPVGEMSGQITSNVPGKSIRDIFGTATNITLFILDENGVKVGTVKATDASDGKNGLYKTAQSNPRHFGIRASGIWLSYQLQWEYYEQWTTGDDSHNITNIVLTSVTPIPQWHGIKGDITGSVAGYTADQWFGGKDKIAIKVYDANNKFVDMGMSHQGYGSAPLSYDIKIDNPSGYRVEAPNYHITNQLKYEWDYQVKSDVNSVRTIDIQLKNVNPFVVVTAPAANTKIWLNQQVKIDWVGPPTDTPVIVGFRWPAKYGADYYRITTLGTNPGTYTWNLKSYPYGYPYPPVVNNNDAAYCSGFISLRGGGYGNNQYWTWTADVPVWFMTPYVKITNIPAASTYHAGDQLTINFEKAGLSSPEVKVSLASIVNPDQQIAVWHTTGNSLSITLPTQNFGDPQFMLTADAEGEGGGIPGQSAATAANSYVLININQ